MDHLFGFSCMYYFVWSSYYSLSLDNQNIKSVMSGSTESKEYETVGAKVLV